MNLAIIGDFDPGFRPHVATNEAIEHSRHSLQLSIQYDWIPTDTIMSNLSTIQEDYSGFWIAPGSPYRSMAGALEIIQYARLNKVPVLGTCGGFQHMMIEFARNVLYIADAQHAEYDPYASDLIVNPLSCSLAGQTLHIHLAHKSSLTYRIYGSDRIQEKYYCNFGLNPAYQQRIHDAGLTITGVDDHQEARILELTNHPFFMATLFVPQDNSTKEQPHPLVTAFLKAVEKMANEKAVLREP